MKPTFAALIEAASEARGGKWRIRVMRGGLSGNRNFYPDAVVREAAPLFDGARVFVKGDSEHLKGGGKDFRNLIGRLSNAAFVEGRGAPGELHADLELIDPAGDIARKLREAWDRNMTDLFGFSIDARGAAVTRTMSGKPVREVRRIEAVDSVDLIVEPGAGGQVVNLIESQNKDRDMDKYLTQDQLKLRLIESKLPDAARERLLESYADAAELTEKELREAIDREREYLGKLTESGKVKDLGEPARVEFGEQRHEKVAKMLDAFFDPKDSSVVSIREAYVDITGDRRVTGLTANCDRVRLRESLGSASFAEVLGDSVARRLVALYSTPNLYDVWRALVKIVPVNDFRTQRRPRFGGYGDMPTVAEGQPYLSLASPNDEEATYAIVKRGGTEDVTLEMIANDDVGAVRQIPEKLNRAAKRTCSKFVLDFLKDNPAIYDGVALFHANHNNLGAAALDGTTVAAGRLAMKRQTEADSADRLGIPPRFLVVPDDLEEAAVDLFRRNTNNDKNFVQSLTLDVVPVWYWTDASDWCLVADPNDIPSIEVGFFGGHEEPELFVQDSPTLGSMFTHDKVTYKIRHIYGGAVTDYRGLYKAVVA